MRKLMLVVLLSACGEAWSQDCTLPKPYIDSLLLQLDLQGCFGGEADTSAISVDIHNGVDAFGDKNADSEAELRVRADAAQLLSRVDQSLAMAITSATPEWKPHLADLRSGVGGAWQLVRIQGSKLPATHWDHQDLTYFGRIDIAAATKRDCASDSPQCQSALVSAGEFMRHAELVHLVFLRLADVVVLASMQEELHVINAKWDFYLTKGRSQYPWELLLNSAPYKPLVAANKVAPPPNGQWILLHPTAAIEAASGVNGSEEVNAVAIVELVGYNWLRYPEDGKHGQSMGISAIATISPESGGERIGWGVMVHLSETISLGAARRDIGFGRETTWLVSADMAKVFLDNREKAEKLFPLAR